MSNILNCIKQIILTLLLTFGCTFSVGDEVARDDKIVSVNPKDSYFVGELISTINMTQSLKENDSLVFTIVTDNHFSSDKEEQAMQWQSVENIKNFNMACECNALIHLGDVVAQSLYDNDHKTDSEIQQIGKEYIEKLSECNSHFYCINGNHDGWSANHFSPSWWYPIGKATFGIEVIRQDNNPYYYVDYEDKKVRCIFLATPDNPTGARTIYGYSDRMLEWFANIALKTGDEWSILIFAHMPPFSKTNGNDMYNKKAFIEICNAFSNRSNYWDDKIYCEYFGNTSNIVAYICGHIHGDLVVYSGEKVGNGDVNELPFPVITVGCNMLGDDGPEWSYVPVRKKGTISQDLWDVLVYSPSKKKINMVRFGGGEDREITLD